MSTIIQATMPDNETAVHDLFAEYLRWACLRIYQEYHAVFDADSMIIRDMQKIDVFLPPNGILLLALDDGQLAGCACTRKIGKDIAEMKRMYVRPGFRRRGIGAALVRQTIHEVRGQGYSALRLDSTPPKTAATLPVQPRLERATHSLGGATEKCLSQTADCDPFPISILPS